MQRSRVPRSPGAVILVSVLVAAVTVPAGGSYSHTKNRNFGSGYPSTNLLDKIILLPGHAKSPNSPILDDRANVPLYPLDPLTALEIRTAALAIRAANRTSSFQFLCIGLNEPEKASLVQYFLSGTNPPAGKFDRKAQVLLVDTATQAPAWVTVNLENLRIESWTDAKPNEHAASITTENEDVARSAALSDPQVVAKIKKFGINDMSSIVTDIWESGYVDDNPKYAGVRKLVQVFLYRFLGSGDNFYAHPLDFVVYVDIGAQEVVGIEDLPIHQNFDTTDRTGASVPLTSANYLPGSQSLRDVRPIAISRPKGVSFQVDDRILTWQNFRMHIGYNPREGVVINHVTYNDQGTVRPLFYRMSLSEVFIYFGDPRPPYHRKSSYDEGNFEFGTSAKTLSKQFCRGQAYYLDSVIHSDQAQTTIVPNTTCIFEEDASLLFAHYDAASDQTAVTRSQRLSISSFMNVGSCDYFVSWRFYQDATVELSVRISGIENTNMMAIDVKAPPYGNLMMPQVYTQNFQYLIGARIDADIDGVANTVSMEDVVSVAPAENPYGNGITTQSATFKKVRDAPSDNQPGRTWRVSNPNVSPNSVTGKQSSWKLIPQGANMPNLLLPGSALRKRLSFADHSMWVLPFNDEQVFVDGLYLDCGVSKWTNESLSANLENTDVVLWPVFGLVSTPDPEDWPVISAIPYSVGFKLRPSNFFTQNPAVNVPPASQTTAYDDLPSGWAPAGNSGWGWGS